MKALPKEKIKADAAAVKLSLGERKIFDLVSADADREITKKNPYVVLKYFQDSWECFSAWEKDELKQLSAFLRRLGSHTWQQVYEGLYIILCKRTIGRKLSPCPESQ